MKMKILWATPFNAQSAIARFSHEICVELAGRGHEVGIQRIEVGAAACLRACETNLQVLPAGVVADSANVDISVLNLGNHAQFHAGGLRLAARSPPFVIFHDAEMRDFAWGVRRELSVELEGLCAGFAELLPSAAVDGASADEHLSFYGSLACGAIVHGPHYEPAVAKACPGPVAVVPLCFPDIGAIAPLPRAPGALRVAVFGYINPNKQLGRVLEALSSLGRQGQRSETWVIGTCPPADRLAYRRQANAAGLQPPLFFDHVSDADLCRYLASVDIICCLRYPVTEGGSASLATALYAQRPVIVCDVANYALLPDHTVWKVSYSERTDDLAAAIAAISADRETSNRRAARAREWALTAFSSRNYVDALEPLLERAIAISPWVRTCHTAAALIGGRINPVPPAGLSHVASVVSELACS